MKIGPVDFVCGVDRGMNREWSILFERQRSDKTYALIVLKNISRGIRNFRLSVDSQGISYMK